MKKTIFVFVYYFITILLYAKEVQLAGSIANFQNRHNDEAVIQMNNNEELTYYKLFMEKERLCVVKLIDIEKKNFNPNSYELSMEAKNKANAFKLFLDLMDKEKNVIKNKIISETGFGEVWVDALVLRYCVYNTRNIFVFCIEDGYRNYGGKLVVMSEDGEIDFEKRIITNDLRQVLDGVMILNKHYLCIAVYDIAYHKTIFKIIDISKYLTRSSFSKAKKKYKIFINDCNDFTKSVLREYKKLWKEDYKQKNSDKSRFSIWKAWRNHYKDISKKKGEVYDASK